MKDKYVIFDLDDTLIYEIDYLKSAYYEIAGGLDSDNKDQLFDEMYTWYTQKENVFDLLVDRYPQNNKKTLLNIYREHIPELYLNEGAMDLFEFCKLNKYSIGLITDGRSITQRNKLKALGIENFFDQIIVSEEFGSEKPDERNFRIFMKDDVKEYFYIADNTKKDFITPNVLGWTSICLLDNGNNIHSQTFDVDENSLPKYKVKSLLEVLDLI
ncbi:HAD family hydrolase [Sphingobacterium spiritivorum]|uniref:HAD family hydrolase n=1 Tax=Sphingobacterium spiritivorum TaxID=258 RepID=UPI003DA297C8